MKKRVQGFGILSVIIIIVLTALITSIATGVIMINNTSDNIKINDKTISNDKDLQEFIKVYETLISKYYDSNIDKKGMLNAAEEAMTNFLGDKYTTYLNDKEYKEILDDLSGTYNGIGVEISRCNVLNVTASSPAEKAGILKGDVITAIDGVNISDYIKEEIENNDNIKLTVIRNDEALTYFIKDFKISNIELNSCNIKSELDLGAELGKLMQNDVIAAVNNKSINDIIKNLIKDNSKNIVNLEINRDGKALNFSIKKEDLVNPSIVSKVIDNTSIGYMYIKNFSQNLGTQVSNALKELEDKNITSLIIDVRDNVGGYLYSAEDVASLFIENGKTIYSLETSNSRYSYKDKTKERRTYNIIVLINGNSASASEVLAAALKDSYGALLVGTKSYGKGKVQQVVALDNGSSVKYTSAKWLTPAGICIDGIGLTPDYVVEYDLEANYDNQLEKAIEILK